MCSVHPPAGFHPPRHGSAGWESRLCGSREGAWSLCKWVFLPVFTAPKARSPSTAAWPGATWAPLGVLGSDCESPMPTPFPWKRVSRRPLEAATQPAPRGRQVASWRPASVHKHLAWSLANSCLPRWRLNFSQALCPDTQLTGSRWGPMAPSHLRSHGDMSTLRAPGPRSCSGGKGWPGVGCLSHRRGRGSRGVRRPTGAPPQLNPHLLGMVLLFD